MLLALGMHNVYELRESSANSSKDKEIILENTAKINRKEKLSPNCRLLIGHISSEKQSLSILPRLLHLLPFILDGTTNNQQILAGTKKKSFNLAQLIQYNVMKKMS